MSDCDYEQVDLDESAEEARFTKSDYAQVLFHNIAETYLVGKDIDCRYTITSMLTPSPRDWVGLYKVGWSTASRDYVFYHYISMPEVIDDGKDKDGCIHFQASKLPKEDGEFYQFCYVTGSGHVRGASTPFQFRTTSEEYIEIEDEDNDIMVIRSRTAVLEDDLSKAMREEQNLKKTMELLEHERDTLLSKMLDLERECQAEREEKEEVQNELRVAQEKLDGLVHEAADMSSVQELQKEQLIVLKQEKKSIEARMNDNDQYVVSLRDKIKVLVNEKDALSGKNKSLEEEKDMYKTNFSSSESTLTGYKLEIDNLKKQLQAAETVTNKLKADLEACKNALTGEKRKMERQLSLGQTDKNHIEDLTEKLRNCEDKLLAAEQCKQMLNKELDTVQQAYSKMSDNMEKSKCEAHSLKEKIVRLEEKSRKQEQNWQDQLKFMQGRLDEKSQETEKLTRDVESWRLKFEEMEVEKKTQHEGPMFALQMAQQTLKERLGKKQADNEELKKQLDDLMSRKRNWDCMEVDLKKEIVDLKEHLLMGQDAFRDKYIECQKLKSDLRKALKMKGRSRNTSECKDSSTSTLDSKTVREEVEVQTSHTPTASKNTATDSESKTDGVCQTGESMRVEDLADLTNTEIQSQLDDLAKELEKRKAQKNKYKALLAEEKEKNALLQKHYFEQVRKAEEEVARVKADCQDKIHVLTQKNNILKNALDKATENNRIMERVDSVESGSQVTDATYNAGLVMSPVLNFPCTGESSMGLNQPLPLRFGSPATQPTIIHATQAPYIQPTLTPTSHSPPRGEALAKAYMDEGYRCPGRDVPPSPTQHAVTAEYDPLVVDVEEQEEVKRSDMSPLPPPLEPELTADAKKAAVMAAMKGGSGSSSMEEIRAEDIFPDVVQQQPSAPPAADDVTADSNEPDPDDEGFQDAQGEPQKICPICNMVFSADTPNPAFLDHIDTHYGPVCPVCSRQFDDGFPPTKFQEHVETHFDD